MPPRKRKNSVKHKKGGASISTVNNFTSSRNITPPPSQANTPAYQANVTPAKNGSYLKTLFTPKDSNRLLSVPVSIAASAASAASAATSVKPRNGVSIIGYILIFIILGFMAVTLFLFLEKPVGTSITHLYDPLIHYVKVKLKVDERPNAIDTLHNSLEDKKVVNNIDNATTATTAKSNSTYKKKPVVVPEADDTTSRTQMKSNSKAGYCYIGEDRGFRSCIEVGEGDVCMSGDIFPTQAVCINPNLRE